MKTIKNRVEKTLKIKGSKFIGICFPCRSVSDFKYTLLELQRDHQKASHHCYAYFIKKDKKFLDDGEPKGTAGMPILKKIEENELIDVGVVVIRYFGGVLLGKGGLQRAYGQAADICLKAAKKTQRLVEIDLRFKWKDMNHVMTKLKRFESADIIYQIENLNCYIRLDIGEDDYWLLEKELDGRCIIGVYKKGFLSGGETKEDSAI